MCLTKKKSQGYKTTNDVTVYRRSERGQQTRHKIRTKKNRVGKHKRIQKVKNEKIPTTAAGTSK